MKKVLFCASTASHIRNFHLPYLQAFRERGWEVWVAADTAEPIPYADHVVALPFCKRLCSPQNLLALWRVRRLLRREQFDLLSAHTTLAGAVCRGAALLLRRRPRICYTCHGYLFGEGDGPRKWAYLLPEWLCGFVTDTLLVMNGEDQAIAEKHRLCRGRLRSIPGMGFDGGRFAPAPPAVRAARRREWGFAADEVVFVYAAEFSRRKNQAYLLRAFAKAAPQMPSARLLLAGEGELLASCKALAADLGIAERVRFPGRVEDMAALYPLCDAVVSSSRIEGLPFHLMEAMACGLPAAVTEIKGHRELVEQDKTGLLCCDETDLARAMEKLYNDPALRARFGEAAREKAMGFALECVEPVVLAAYGQSEI